MNPAKVPRRGTGRQQGSFLARAQARRPVSGLEPALCPSAAAVPGWLPSGMASLGCFAHGQQDR